MTHSSDKRYGRQGGRFVPPPQSKRLEQQVDDWRKRRDALEAVTTAAQQQLGLFDDAAGGEGG